jgi:hypothetical protein
MGLNCVGMPRSRFTPCSLLNLVASSRRPQSPGRLETNSMSREKKKSLNIWLEKNFTNKEIAELNEQSNIEAKSLVDFEGPLKPIACNSLKNSGGVWQNY